MRNLGVSILREPLKIHFGKQANLFNSVLRQAKAALGLTKAHLPSLTEIKNLLLVAQKQLLELPLILMVSVAVCGCKKENAGAESRKEEQIRKEAVMGVTIQWLGHASFRICYEDKVIYIDPWKIKEPVGDATLVLVSHSHYDHYSAEDIAKVSGVDSKLIASTDVVAKEKAGEAVLPGLTVELESVRVTGVPAYNPAKQYHPKGNNWVGFIIEIGAQRIYYAGDTDLTDEMKALKDIDVALLPVGGTYTMGAKEAAEATGYIQLKLAIPYHWGDIVGGRSDAEQFGEQVKCNVKILSPGQTITIEE